MGEAGAVLEIPVVWLELETGDCSGWVFLLFWWFGVVGAEQKLGDEQCLPRGLCGSQGRPLHGQKSYGEGSQGIIQSVAPALGPWLTSGFRGLFVMRWSARGRLLESCSVCAALPLQADRCLLSWIFEEKKN